MMHLEMLLKGFGVNILITAATVCLLLIPGILLTFLAKKFPVIGKIFGWLSIPWECICPVAMIVWLSFLDPTARIMLGEINIYRCLLVILSLILAYMGYMPARFVPEYSFLKNVLYNGFGMISAVFKWSFCAFIIGCPDLLHYARCVSITHYRYGIVLTALAASFVCLFVIELLRRIIKQFMK